MMNLDIDNSLSVAVESNADPISKFLDKNVYPLTKTPFLKIPEKRLLKDQWIVLNAEDKVLAAVQIALVDVRDVTLGQYLVEEAAVDFNEDPTGAVEPRDATLLRERFQNVTRLGSYYFDQRRADVSKRVLGEFAHKLYEFILVDHPLSELIFSISGEGAIDAGLEMGVHPTALVLSPLRWGNPPPGRGNSEWLLGHRRCDVEWTMENSAKEGDMSKALWVSS